jgi:hypothetical protein
VAPNKLVTLTAKITIEVLFLRHGCGSDWGKRMATELRLELNRGVMTEDNSSQPCIHTRQTDTSNTLQ